MRYAGEQGAQWQRRCVLIAAAVAIMAVLGLGAAGAARAADQEVITSAGPMSDIYLNNDLGCQVSMLNDTATSAFFGQTDPGGCGTFLQINAVDAGVASGDPVVFGPDVSEGFAGGGSQVVPDFTPLGQALAGSGTTASPFTVTTTDAVCAAATGTTQPAGACPAGDVEVADVVETDTYVVGSDEYNTSVQIINKYDAAISGTLYHAADCFLEQDNGYGALGAGNAPECTLTPGNTPAGRFMSFIPVSGPSGSDYGYFEGAYPDFWQDITSAGNLYPNSADPSGNVDNGMGLSWTYSVPAAGSTTIGFSTLVSPAPPAASTSAPKVLGSEKATFSATVNPDGAATTVAFEYGLDPKYGLSTTASLYVDHTALQTVGSGTAPVTVTATATGLVPHALYHVRVVATSADGTTMGNDRTFTTAAGPPPPPPVIGQEANFTPVSGVVYVKPAGATAAAVNTTGHGFIPLTDARQLPVGSQIDARHGKLKLTLATSKKHGKHKASTQTGLFYGGLFSVGQSKRASLKGLTTLKLIDNGAFAGAPSYSKCTAGKSSSDAVAIIAKGKPLNNKVLNTLNANEHGNYKTQGKYSAATVRGTHFSVSDLCGGTLTHVYHGLVVVTVNRTHKHHTLHTGQSYLAKAP